MARHQADYTGTNWGCWGVMIGAIPICWFIGFEAAIDLIPWLLLALAGGLALRNGWLTFRGVASPAEVVLFFICAVIVACYAAALGPAMTILCGIGGGLVLMMFGKLGNDTINNVRYVRDSYDDSFGVQERRLKPLERRARAKRRAQYRRSYHGGMGRCE